MPKVLLRATTTTTTTTVELSKVVHRARARRNRVVHGLELFQEQVLVLLQPVLFLLRAQVPIFGAAIKRTGFVRQYTVLVLSKRVGDATHYIHDPLAVRVTSQELRYAR